jgi:hypothetical protein
VRRKATERVVARAMVAGGERVWEEDGWEVVEEEPDGELVGEVAVESELEVASEGVNVVENETVVGRESRVVKRMKVVGSLGFAPGSGINVISSRSVVDDAAAEAGSPAVEPPPTRLW